MTNASAVSQGSSFSMEFLIDVDALFAFETICEESIGALTRADGDVARASAIVSQQESLLVHRCNEDLLTTSQTYEEMAADLKALKLPSRTWRGRCGRCGASIRGLLRLRPRVV